MSKMGNIMITLESEFPGEDQQQNLHDFYSFLSSGRFLQSEINVDHYYDTVRKVSESLEDVLDYWITQRKVSLTVNK